MNRSEKIIKLLEDHIDPEEPYPYDKDKIRMAFKDRDHTIPTHNRLVKEAFKHIDPNNMDDRGRSIANYTGTSYGHINNHLRHGTKIGDEQMKHIEPLKSLTKNPTEHHFTVYRGAKEKLFDHQKGTIFKDKGFTSTSLRPSLADKFSTYDSKNKEKPEEDRHRYRIHITPGTKGHYLSGHSSAGESEREFLLHPGTHFKVGDTHDHANGMRYTDLHIHHQED